MTKFEKNYKLLTNRQQIDNIFLCIYINNFVKLFRYYNNDKFLITISGLKNFINEDEEDIIYLLKQLEENDFTIKFEGNDESISILEIICENISNDTTYSYKYDIQDLPSIIELSSKTNIPAVGIIIMKVVARIIIKLKTLYKAIVLDLDDTLWKGTLTEDGISKIRENMQSEEGAPFIEFMKYIKMLGNELGLFITIC